MRKLILITAVALTPLNAQARAEIVKLTVKKAVQMTVERNLDLRNELFNAVVAKEEMRRNKGIYDPLVSLNASYQDSSTIPSSIGGATFQKTLKVVPALTQLLRAGGTIGFEFNNSRTETDYVLSTDDNYWESDLAFTLSQPLLRNFGSDVTNLNITLAEQSREAAIKRVAAKVEAVIAQIRIEYFKLRSLAEDLQAKKVSLGLAQRILGEVSERVKAGLLPSMEVLNAEFGVASREKELLEAEKAFKDQVDLLRQVLHLPTTVDIEAAEAPGLQMLFLDEQNAISHALALRPEIEEARITIASAEAQQRAARNKTLPGLTLTGSYAVTGLSGVYTRNLDRLSSTDYPVWSVGIQFDYPIGNDAAEGEWRKSLLRVDQARSQLENLTSEVVTEVRAAVRGVEVSFKRLDVTARGRVFAEERLNAYIAKAEAGLATTKDVLDVENDFVAARTEEIKAQGTYAISVTQFLQVTGQLLEQEGIIVNGTTIERLLPPSLPSTGK